MKQGIIFDMDGTLWDSTVGVAESWNEILKQEKVNRTPLTVEDFRGIMGKTMDVIAAKFFPDMPEKERMELLDKCGEYENEYLSGHGAVLYPGVEETFAKLKEKYELYIVSNCQSGYIEAFLSYYKLGKYISDIECYGNNEKQKEDNIALVVSRNALTDAVYVEISRAITNPAKRQESLLSMQHMDLAQLMMKYRKLKICHSFRKW